jgi:hypothetical protein
MTEISLLRLRRTIRKRFPEDDREERKRALWCFRKLWGWPDCNDVGVFNNWEEIRIDLKGKKQWHVEIELALAPNGLYTYGLCWWSPEQGGGFAPAVSCSTAWTTREEAVQTALEEASWRYHKLAANERESDAIRQSATRMIEVLKSHMPMPEPDEPDEPAPGQQLTLF